LIAAGAGWAGGLSEEIVLVLGVLSAIFLLSAATSYIANRWLLAKGSLFDHFLEAKRSSRARWFKRAFLGAICVGLFLMLVGTSILHGPAMGLGFLLLFGASFSIFWFLARARNRRNTDLWEWFENLE
jgi:Flp pilus assembly protein TadB